MRCFLCWIKQEHVYNIAVQVLHYAYKGNPCLRELFLTNSIIEIYDKNNHRLLVHFCLTRIMWSDKNTLFFCKTLYAYIIHANAAKQESINTVLELLKRLRNSDLSWSRTEMSFNLETSHLDLCLCVTK